MKKNPKTIIGLCLMAVLLAGTAFLIIRLIPTAGEVRREMSLTPTPLPAVPGSVMAVTPDPAAPTAEPVLRTGSRGQEVKDLQSRLYTLGYYTDEFDGQFGPATQAAVKEFQKANGLDADGMVGSETREVLFSAAAKPKN
jgi:peptidoglycan hydrolase-like protein with peptidoglycan-binding domain